MKAEQIAQRLGLPLLALEGLQQLNAQQLDALAVYLEQALERQQQELDAALVDAIPWLFRAPLLRWLRRQ